MPHTTGYNISSVLTCLRRVPVLLRRCSPAIGAWPRTPSWALSALKPEGVRVKVPVEPGTRPRGRGWGARCVSGVARWRLRAGRRQGGQSQAALPAGAAPVILPHPALQLRAVLRPAGAGCGRLPRLGPGVVGRSRGRHVDWATWTAWATPESLLLLQVLLH